MSNLTRIILHNNRNVLHMLSSPERIHATVMHGFPDGCGERILWRVDDHQSLTYIYVVSDSIPDYGFITERFDDSAIYKTMGYDGFLESLKNGERFKFTVSCNPIINKKDGSYDKRGKRVPLVGKMAKSWIEQKLHDNGLSDIRLDTEHHESNLVFTKQGNHRITIKKQVYSGIATIEDRDALSHLMVNGFGSAKAYGCGLLTLEPLH